MAGAGPSQKAGTTHGDGFQRNDPQASELLRAVSLIIATGNAGRVTADRPAFMRNPDGQCACDTGVAGWQHLNV